MYKSKLIYDYFCRKGEKHMYINIEKYFGDFRKDNVGILNDYISILDSKVKKYYN